MECRALSVVLRTITMPVVCFKCLFLVLVSLLKMIQAERLYMVHFPLLAQIVGDVDASGAYRNKSMMAPIALFVATSDSSFPLKPVAIQLGHTRELL